MRVVDSDRGPGGLGEEPSIEEGERLPTEAQEAAARAMLYKVWELSESTRKSYTQPGSSWRPSACLADVIATRPWVLLLKARSMRSRLAARAGRWKRHGGRSLGNGRGRSNENEARESRSSSRLLWSQTRKRHSLEGS